MTLKEFKLKQEEIDIMIKRNLVKNTMAAAIIALGVITTATGCGCSRAVDVPTYVEENQSVSESIGETEEVITTHVAEYGDAEDAAHQEETETLETYISEEYTKETSTEKSTKETTEAPIKATQETTTEAPTQKVTEPATQKQTEAPTQKPTEPVTEPATQKPTEAPTQKSTESATEAPTQKPTEAPKHSHNYTSRVTLEPTCVATGIRTFICSCGSSYTENIPAIGHSFGTYTYNNDATEQVDGTETAICSVCGEKNTRTASGTKLAHVHKYTPAVTKAATCAEEGVTTYTCSCGHGYTEPVAKTAHSFGEYVYNNDATTEADGTKTRTCSVCGKTDTVTAEGTKKSLPSWYDEHPDIPLNQTRGSQDDGSLEVYFTDFDWTGASMGSDAFGYSVASVTVGKYAEGWVMHGYLY